MHRRNRVDPSSGSQRDQTFWEWSAAFAIECHSGDISIQTHLGNWLTVHGFHKPNLIPVLFGLFSLSAAEARDQASCRNVERCVGWQTEVIRWHYCNGVGDHFRAGVFLLCIRYRTSVEGCFLQLRAESSLPWKKDFVLNTEWRKDSVWNELSRRVELWSGRFWLTFQMQKTKYERHFQAKLSEPRPCKRCKTLAL